MKIPTQMTNTIGTNLASKSTFAPKPKSYSRRDLFTSLYSPGDRLKTITERQTATQPEPGRQEISRNGFIKLMAMGLGAMGLSTVIPNTANATTLDKDKDSDDFPVTTIPKAKTVPESNDQNAWFSTIMESILLYASGRASNATLEKIGIPYGNKGLDAEVITKQMKEKPGFLFFRAVILGPAVEEYAFRYLISRTFLGNTRGPMRWDIGLPSAVFFSLVHNLSTKVEADKIDKFPFIKKISFNADYHISVPISQFLTGVYCWYAMRKKGIAHAIFGHSAFNSMAFLRHWHSTHNSANIEE